MLMHMFLQRPLRTSTHGSYLPSLLRHVHLDEPGRTQWEGFYTGTRAAAAGFWGGLIPENALNTSILEGLLSAGVLGLKEGLSVLAKYRRPLLVHAEKQHQSKNHLNDKGDHHAYLTYLNTKPPSWEQAAIKELVGVTKHTRIGSSLEGAHVHIAHLSDSSASLDLIKEAKSHGDSISVETCPHYLAFSSEDIPNGDTRFKCSPPIRDAFNKEKLWEAVLEGHIDLLSSDHSPTVPGLKLLEEGDFLKAWGGISSLQGAIAVGNHADIVVWHPELEFDLNDDYPVFLKHPGLSVYMGRRLSGKVSDTFVRGNLVFKKGKHAPAACGVPILAK
ncbi:hypothetical protein Fmac_009847 [Flemingia macrophylla]|uniref:Allantoinase n=1 Tax=Flemingia macrophylla TaxID=520843 RepID=A0ABD1N1D9_9FABA